MPLKRTIAYFDGYNMYHALKKTCDSKHLWLDLWALAKRFVPPVTHTLAEVHYFSAYAHWKPLQMQRHRAYVAALESVGVTVHLARFSNKDRKCPKCGHFWVGHEEKETDVKIAVSILQDAVQNKFDRAILVSRDSDLVPAAKALKAVFPNKELHIVAPPSAGHSTEMLNYCDGKHKIKKAQLDSCLLPQNLVHPDGRHIVRPTEYDP